MIEVESKFWSPGNDKVEKALLRLGAKKVSEGAMEDVYFAHPNKDFGKTDEALRLRKRDGTAELTYKGPRMRMEHTKAREEITVAVGDPLAAQRIVERLGFQERHVVSKRRTTYVLDKLRVEVDEVEGLGQFIELELITEEPQRAEVLISMAQEQLGLERGEPRTYLEMLIEKKSSG
ncbi:MAG: class IV adenylate cyclase [Thermoplasmata archaeon]|nr:class IV adenylate cyclase [Thermoplasmata archaeon]